MSSNDEFDQAESAVEYGRSWRFREEGNPNPLTIRVTGWSLDVAMPNGDLVDFMRGTDRDGEAWSVLVGGAVLKQHLIEGRVEEWNDEKEAFEQTALLGRVQAGQVVSLKYTGDKRSKAGYDYPTFKISRVGEAQADAASTITTAEQREAAAETAPAATEAPAAAPDSKDDIPF